MFYQNANLLLAFFGYMYFFISVLKQLKIYIWITRLQIYEKSRYARAIIVKICYFLSKYFIFTSINILPFVIFISLFFSFFSFCNESILFRFNPWLSQKYFYSQAHNKCFDTRSQHTTKCIFLQSPILYISPTRNHFS